MSNKIEYTLLGTGSSGGVPRIGNDWGACDPDNAKNRRRRCAMLIKRTNEKQQHTSVLIDAGVDMREQLLAEDVKSLDGVLLTHSHADHIFGLDDLRQMAISMRRSVDVYMDVATSSRVMQSFGYCFRQEASSSYPAFCIEHRIAVGNCVAVQGAAGGLNAWPILAEHGDIQSLGFRINDVVYLPDIKRIANEASEKLLSNTRVLVIDALRRKPHPTHLNLEESLDFIKVIQPQRAILTNMHSDLDYDTLRRSLPSNIEPGYDGLKFT